MSNQFFLIRWFQLRAGWFIEANVFKRQKQKTNKEQLLLLSKMQCKRLYFCYTISNIFISRKASNAAIVSIFHFRHKEYLLSMVEN